jgi:hypothetical protein
VEVTPRKVHRVFLDPKPLNRLCTKCCSTCALYDCMPVLHNHYQGPENDNGRQGSSVERMEV